MPEPPLTIAVSTMAAFIAVFVVATWRNVHLGILMFPAACGLGVWLVGMPLKGVVAGFPVNILVLLAGVTFFFGIAQANGTIDRVTGRAIARAGQHPVALPFAFFGLSGAVAAMGSPLGGLVLAPVGMAMAKRSGVDPVLMALAINSGICAGAFAPTSLFGIVSNGTARQAGIALNPFTLLTVSVVANLVLLIVASLIFRGDQFRAKVTAVADVPRAAMDDQPFEWRHAVTAVFLLGLVASVLACAWMGVDPDIGVSALAFGAVLALLDPKAGVAALGRIDWSAVLLVGSVVTFVGVLQKAGSVDLLAGAAKHAGTPMVAALVICFIGGLVSAFASTTGILAALVPLAVPLATSGSVAGWALISALSVCASIVDVSPFSTTGATLIASAAEEDRARLRRVLFRWGMAMIVVGPLVTVAVLVVPGSWW